MRFPEYVSFSRGLEWRFHFRGAHLGSAAFSKHHEHFDPRQGCVTLDQSSSEEQ
jgi:hypothetical protein